jgi:PKHD-type hydroxylase
MIYKYLYNDTKERSRLTYPWVYWDGGFTPEEIKKMCDYFDSQGVERGTTIGSTEVGPNGENIVKVDTNEKSRKSNVKFYNYDKNNQDTLWIFERLNWIIDQANSCFYGFDLNGFDSFQYTEYNDTEEGRYDWHQDMVLGKNMPNDMVETRKLSMTLCLNEYGVDFEGGEFQINSSKESEAEDCPSQLGRAFLFPSYMIHRVKPVTRGKRKSLVVWVLGPKFK